MTPPLSNTNKATEKEGELKQHQSVLIFTLVEGRPTKVGIARLFGESRNLVRRIHKSVLPRHEGKGSNTIHHPTMNRTYADIRYP